MATARILVPRSAAPQEKPDLGSPESGRIALKAFFRLAGAWDLEPAVQMRLLGLRNRSTYALWRNLVDGEPDPPPRSLGPDTLERISYLLGIYKALQILLPDQAAADSWIRRANTAPLFNGQTPLERMNAGQVADLFAVRQFLDAARGGWN